MLWNDIINICQKYLNLAIQYFYNIKNHFINLKLKARVESIKLFLVFFENPKNIYATKNCVINVAYAAPVIP